MARVFRFPILAILIVPFVNFSANADKVESERTKKQTDSPHITPPVRWLRPNERTGVSVLDDDVQILKRIGESGLRVGLQRDLRPGEIPVFL